MESKSLHQIKKGHSNDGRKSSSSGGCKCKLPPGFRFHPTDQELIELYLYPKLSDGYVYSQIIKEANVYDTHPSQLESYDNGDDKKYCFTPRRTRFPKGGRIQRTTTNGGLWRMTSKINEIKHGDGRVLGRKNCLVYLHEGKTKTNWLMHEYVINESWLPPERDENGNLMDSTALCKIFLSKEEQKKMQRIDNSNASASETQTAEVGKQLEEQNLPKKSQTYQKEHPKRKTTGSDTS